MWLIVAAWPTKKLDGATGRHDDRGPEVEPAGLKAPAPDLRAARAAVRLPAIGLMIAGLIDALATVSLVLIVLSQLGIHDDPEPRRRALTLIVALLFCSVGVLCALAGAKMLHLRSRDLCICAGVLALLPIHPGFLVGVLAGPWALVVLGLEEVRAAFAARGPHPESSGPRGYPSPKPDDGAIGAKPVGPEAWPKGPTAPEADFRAARAAVRLPASGLIVVGVIDVLAMCAVLGAAAWNALNPPEEPPITKAVEISASVTKYMPPSIPDGSRVGIDGPAPYEEVARPSIGLWAAAVAFGALGSLTVLAGMIMHALRGRGLCIAGSIVALLPIHPGFLVGIFAGAWSLAVLSQEEVRAAFAARRPPAEASPSSRLARPAGDSLAVRTALRGPALALMIAGAVQIGVAIVVLGYFQMKIEELKIHNWPTVLQAPDGPAFSTIDALAVSAWSWAICFIVIAMGVLSCFGALRMLQMRGYALPVAGCIAAMLPVTPGCVLGLPIGLWALAVLSRPEVSAALSGRVPPIKASLPGDSSIGELL
jgi:hypothetical protein